MRLIKIFPLILILFLLPAKSFADAPEVSADKTSFNFLTGCYFLQDNVTVSMNNHGFKGTIKADEAKVNMYKRKCLAKGKVSLTQEKFLLNCDSAFSKFDDKIVLIVGNVNFKSKDNVTITSTTATYDWEKRVADFYGKVKVKTEKNFKGDENLKPGKIIYAHVSYNIDENKIISLDKNFDAPKIVIPDFDED